jgi:hypothetical protein
MGKSAYRKQKSKELKVKKKEFIEQVKPEKTMLCKFCGRWFYGRVYRTLKEYRVVRCSCCGKLLNIGNKAWIEAKHTC